MMKIGFSFEMDSSNRRDRRIVRDYLQNLARLAPMLGEMVDHLVPPGIGTPVGTVHPFPQQPPPPNLHEAEPVHSMAEFRGRNALRDLVAAWREAAADGRDFNTELMSALAKDGPDILAYVNSVGSLTTAIFTVWGEPGVAMSPTAAEEATKGAREAAGYLVGVASALGFEIPTSWYTNGGV